MTPAMCQALSSSSMAASPKSKFKLRRGASARPWARGTLSRIEYGLLHSVERHNFHFPKDEKGNISKLIVHAVGHSFEVKKTSWCDPFRLMVLGFGAFR